MLHLSDIQSSQEELDEYYAQLRAQHVTPAWIGGGISIEPQSKAVRAHQQWRPPGLLIQLQRRAGDEGLEPLPRGDQGIAAGPRHRDLTSDQGAKCPN